MLISLDFGITITDILRKDGEGNLTHQMLPSNQKPSEEFILELFKDLNFIKDVDCLALTGGHHQLIGEKIEQTPVIHVNEVDAIGEGGFALSNLDPSKPAIIVSSGSGTACILAKDGVFTHCSGTGVGGGTVLGLSKLLLNTTDPEEIQDLASQGLAKGTDLILEDVVSGPIGLLPTDTTAVNFGKIARLDISASREDLAAGKVNLVGETVARIATSVAVGLAKGTDLILEDVVSGPIGLLPTDTTAVNFGKIARLDISASREDLAAGIVNLVGETVARIATSVAVGFEVTDIIVVGRTPTFTALRKSLEAAALLTNFTPHFPPNAEYASALGAMLVAEKNPNS